MSGLIDENARIADDIHNAYEEGYADGKRDAVAHGHWKHIFGGFVECSNCGVFPLLDGERKYVESDFCPCCGALMDEVEE